MTVQWWCGLWIVCVHSWKQFSTYINQAKPNTTISRSFVSQTFSPNSTRHNWKNEPFSIRNIFYQVYLLLFISLLLNPTENTHITFLPRTNLYFAATIFSVCLWIYLSVGFFWLPRYDRNKIIKLIIIHISVVWCAMYPHTTTDSEWVQHT